MTLDEFRATRQEASNIGRKIGDKQMLGVSGLIYGVDRDLFFIRDAPFGGYEMDLDRDFVTSDSLADLEERLFTFCQDAGYFTEA